jgi:hypothetical protein
MCKRSIYNVSIKLQAQCNPGYPRIDFYSKLPRYLPTTDMQHGWKTLFVQARKSGASTFMHVCQSFYVLPNILCIDPARLDDLKTDRKVTHDYKNTLCELKAEPEKR